MNYSVKLEDFEGPLDLLLHLIRKNKIDILDIPIAEITRQYNQIIDSWTFFDMEEACDYLDMATRLMKIKSQLILPREKVELTGEDDPRIELAEQLQTYAIFQEIAKVFEPVISENLLSYSKDPEYHPEFEIQELSSLKTATLGRIMHRIILANSDPEETVVSVKPEKYTVKSKMEFLHNQLKEKKKLTFRELISNRKETEEIITIFMAILELYKIGKLFFKQYEKEIVIYAQ